MRYKVESARESLVVPFGDETTGCITFRVGDVRLLRPLSHKGDLFPPFLPTRSIILVFPSCIAPDRVSVGEGAPGAIARFLQHAREQSKVDFAVADAALCRSSGCAILIILCANVPEALDVLEACTDRQQQDAFMRMDGLYVSAYPCDNTCLTSSYSVTDAIAPCLTEYYVVPTCPICADRLEKPTSGIFECSSLCACEQNDCECRCFQRSCCRVCQLLFATFHDDGNKYIKCQDCGTSGDPWICLICGYVGCSRYQAMHAKDHFVRFSHLFSINLLTQQIWDYDRDAFTHRVVMAFDASTGRARRVQFPGRDDLTFDEEPEVTDSAMEKKQLNGKYDIKLGNCYTQYATLLKKELDEMRAMGEARNTNSAAVLIDTQGERCYSVMETLGEIAATFTKSMQEANSTAYALENLQHELISASCQVDALEREHATALESLRDVVKQNVQTELQLNSAVNDMKLTIKEIKLNVKTARSVMNRMDEKDSESKIILIGGKATSASKKSALKRHPRAQKREPETET